MSTPSQVLPTAARPLLTLLDRAEPPLLIVVGSGISLGATAEPRSTWRGLLLHGVDHLERLGLWLPKRAEAERTIIEAAFAENFDLDEVLRRADSVSESLGTHEGQLFTEWLEVSIGTLSPRSGHTASLESLRDLADAGALLMTTNYDSLLCRMTGLPAVTWEEPGEFLRVVNRERSGILHVHGHWQKPTSVVFGKKSYDRIVAASDLQDTLKGLWQQWHWFFVGCGSGLEDPNLGKLLAWGSERFGRAARSDFFLGKSADAPPAARSDQPASRVIISYADHSNLPELLKALTPEARAWPFVRLTADSKHFRQPRESPLQNPFPSYQDYLAGNVPTLAADHEVEQRLSSFGWAFVLDAASVGKTTLALRLATSPAQRNQPVFSLELHQTTSDADIFESDASAAMRRLARPGALLVLDNAHHQPDLAAKLWDQWHSRPGGSRLLILATLMDKPLRLAGDNALSSLERHPVNSAIQLRPNPEDLGKIFLHVMSRFPWARSTGLLGPPPSSLGEWHRTYGSELGAFTAAVTNRHAQLSMGNWDLPETAAAEWMQERHIARLDTAELENTVCLSVFGVQELELDVPQTALPHPNVFRQLLARGLVERIEVAGGKWVRFGLREPSWGRLILAAVSPPPDTRRILTEAAAKNLVLTMALNSRLERAGRKDDQVNLWESLASQPQYLVEQMFEMPISYVRAFLNAAKEQGQDDLANGFWSALAEQPQRLAERAFETPLGDLAAFLNAAKAQGQDNLASGLWSALAKQQQRLAERAFEAPLHILSTFLNAAKAQDQDDLARGLWSALAKQQRRLAERAFEAPLGNLAAFLNAAKAQGQDDLAKGLWSALAKQQQRLAERTFEAPLSDLAAFLNAAKAHSQSELARAVWEKLSSQPDRLAARVLDTSLVNLTGFLAVMRAQGKTALIDMICPILREHQESLAQAASKEPIRSLAAFLSQAPADLAGEIVARFELAEWTRSAFPPDLYSRERAASLALQFGTLGREDLKEALLENLVHRAEPWDFAYPAALIEIAKLLANIPPSAKRNLDRFIQRVCISSRWIDEGYRTLSCLALAEALTYLAFRQSPEVIRTLRRASLGTRIAVELVATADLNLEAIPGVVQLLGAAQLAGCLMPRSTFANLPLPEFARLPSEALPHRAEAMSVEPNQLQLWLGMRVVAALAPGTLSVDPATLGQTLDLWRVNLAETAPEPERTPHRLNLSMVAWLERCARRGSGNLLRNPEPLWVLAGFPRDPRAQ